VVRLSGPESLAIAAEIFTPARGPLADAPGFSALDGTLRLPEARMPARAYVFRAPTSYTRQDIVELHVPGSVVVQRLALDALTAAGARCAEAGEFTARAFFSGRIDLSEAEAVADLIHASDATQCRWATGMLDGALHRLTSQAASEIADLLAVVEASIDLAEEDIHLDSPTALARKVQDLRQRLDRTAATAQEIPDAMSAPTVVLAGRPNVGKSSLLNALTGTDRAIVSALAGTTRDVLRATAQIGPSAVELLDAAGLAPAGDTLEGLADSAARKVISAADAVLFVFEASGFTDGDREVLQLTGQVNPEAPRLLLANKADLPEALAGAQLNEAARLAGAGDSVLRVSAFSGEGLADLGEAIGAMLHLRAYRGSEGLALHRRQKRALRDAGQALQQAGDLILSSRAIADQADLAAIELRSALSHLGLISGQVVTEEILGRIFQRFCVGK
jgi:tRNA modification GTPase